MELPRGSDRAAVARWFDQALHKRVMPYWCRTAPDPVRGGYRLGDRHETGRQAWRRALGRWARRLIRRDRTVTPHPRKHTITQARMVYGLSLAHRLGYEDGNDDLLRAAEIGYRFLAGVLLDGDLGGLYAVADGDGTIQDPRKLLLGQAFGIYGLVEYYRATGEGAALELALRIYRTVQAHLHDRAHGGWTEHADREFRHLRLSAPRPYNVVGLPEHKSADAHLHWMEALSELCEASGDAEVTSSLAEAVQVNRTHFFCDLGMSRALLTRDWRPLDDPKFAQISYGHLLEFAWLMIRAQQVLGAPPAWEHFDEILTFALRRGIDPVHGGVHNRGYTDGRSNDTRRTWWAQAEGIAALSDAMVHRPTLEYGVALDGVVDWVLQHHVLTEDAIWIAMVDGSGRPVDLTKAGPWKGAYHDVRAMTKYVAAFAGATVSR